MLTIPSNRLRPMFAGADADAIVHRQDEDFSVADLSRLARAAAFDDRVDRRFDKIVVHGNLQLHFAEQIDADFAAAIDFGLPFLSAKALDIHDRQPHDLDFRKGRFDVFQLAGLNNGED